MSISTLLAGGESGLGVCNSRLKAGKKQSGKGNQKRLSIPAEQLNPDELVGCQFTELPLAAVILSRNRLNVS